MTSDPIIYLDHAAATPLDPKVERAMAPFAREQFYNPSALYSAARSVRGAIDTARGAVAARLGAKPTEIIFTSSSTESINLAVAGVLEVCPAATWVTTAIEHEAVIAQVDILRERGHDAIVIGVDHSGIVATADIIAAVTDQTALISLMLINNEIGTLQPVAEVATAVAQIRSERTARGIDTPLYLHTDATQAGNYMSLQVSRLGVDLLSFNSSKLYGPKGVGVLYVRHDTRLTPIMYGGGQERGRRSGTENVAGIVGLAAALDQADAIRAREARRLSSLRDELIRQLRATIPDARLNGDARRRIPNNVNLTFPGADGETLVMYLDAEGILAATGAACSASDTQPSHVLRALGLSVADAQSSLRISLGRSTSERDIARVIERLPVLVARLRQLNGRTD